MRLSKVIVNNEDVYMDVLGTRLEEPFLVIRQRWALDDERVIRIHIEEIATYTVEPQDPPRFSVSNV